VNHGNGGFGNLLKGDRPSAPYGTDFNTNLPRNPDFKDYAIAAINSDNIGKNSGIRGSYGAAIGQWLSTRYINAFLYFGSTDIPDVEGTVSVQQMSREKEITLPPFAIELLRNNDKITAFTEGLQKGAFIAKVSGIQQYNLISLPFRDKILNTYENLTKKEKDSFKLTYKITLEGYNGRDHAIDVGYDGPDANKEKTKHLNSIVYLKKVDASYKYRREGTAGELGFLAKTKVSNLGTNNFNSESFLTNINNTNENYEEQTIPTILSQVEDKKSLDNY
jgi:hypothetical protein